MNYLSVENISKSFGERLLFENLSFGISKDQKIALVAKNGTGKTTLLNIIAGVDTPDTGSVVSRNGLRIAYLAQKDRPMKTNSHRVDQILGTTYVVLSTWYLISQTSEYERKETYRCKFETRKCINLDYEETT